MTPLRSEKIGDSVVNEYYWAGEWPVYVDHGLVNETFEQAVERLRNQQLAKLTGEP